jgi:hypothetical protein
MTHSEQIICLERLSTLLHESHSGEPRTKKDYEALQAIANAIRTKTFDYNLLEILEASVLFTTTGRCEVYNMLATQSYYAGFVDVSLILALQLALADANKSSGNHEHIMVAKC